MKKNKKFIVLFISLFFLLFAGSNELVSISTEATEKNSNGPISTNENMDIIRVGYAEGEPWIEFSGHLYAIAKGLEERGIISGVEDLPYEFGQFDSLEMWDWLAENAKSDHIKFVKDIHYSFSSTADGAEEELLTLLKNEEIDLMIAMGTYSGQLLAVDDHKIPTLVFSASNAEFAGIIDSVDDSGKDHIWAHMDPGRYARQVEAFHDIFQFERLGIVIEDSTLGRVFSDMAALQKVSESRGFELVERYVDEPNSHEDRQRYNSELIAAHEKLAGEVDAFLIAIAAIDPLDLPNLLQPFYDAKIPVFSQMGGESVQHGALMALTRTDFLEMGFFGASIIEEVILGAKPRELPQVYVDTPKIILNLDVAEKINYKAPFEILLVADEIYHEIKR